MIHQATMAVVEYGILTIEVFPSAVVIGLAVTFVYAHFGFPDPFSVC